MHESTLYRVFAILQVDTAAQILSKLSDLDEVGRYQTTLVTEDASSVVRAGQLRRFARLTLSDARGGANAWETNGFPTELAECLNYALLNGAQVLLLRNVP